MWTRTWADSRGLTDRIWGGSEYNSKEDQPKRNKETVSRTHAEGKFVPQTRFHTQLRENLQFCIEQVEGY